MASWMNNESRKWPRELGVAWRETVQIQWVSGSGGSAGAAWRVGDCGRGVTVAGVRDWSVVSVSRRWREAVSILRFSSSRSSVDWIAVRAARRVAAEAKARVGEARDEGASCGGEGAAARVLGGVA